MARLHQFNGGYLGADALSDNTVKGVWALGENTSSLQLGGGAALATGGNVTQDVNGYRVHSFTSNGNLTVTKQGEAEIFLVGGGGGGTGNISGGGGGGVIMKKVILPSGTHSVVIGLGGAAESGNGGQTTFLNQIALGGGKGRGGNVPSSGTVASSGGGSDAESPNAYNYTPGQGHTGGNKLSGANGGGGGGAGGPGGNGSSTNQDIGGTGGPGIPIDWRGNTEWFAGGGGGAGASGWSHGGIGGGGNGGRVQQQSTSPGGANQGGGGGGGYAINGSAGGSGIAIIRYKI